MSPILSKAAKAGQSDILIHPPAPPSPLLTQFVTVDWVFTPESSSLYRLQELTAAPSRLSAFARAII